MTVPVAFHLCSLLLVAVAFTGLLLTGQLPPALSALGLGALALGGARAAGWVPDWGLFRLSRRAWNLLLLAVCAGLAVDLLWITRDPLAAGVYLLVALMVNKLLTLRERADYAHLHAISFLQLLACAALTVELWYAIVFVLYLLTAVWTLLLFHVTGAPAAAPGGRRARGPLTPEFFWATNGVAVGALGLTLVIFFLTPRVGAGFFQKGRGETVRTTGFSSKVDLGEIGSVKLDETVVMRVVLPDHQAPVEERLYFRGAAFDVYNGRAWVNSLNPRHSLERSASGAFIVPGARRPAPDGPDRRPVLGRAGLRQEILMEVLDTTVLFGATFVETVEGGFPALQRDGMGSLHLPYPATLRFQYRVASLPPRLADRDRTDAAPAYPESITGRFLQLPPMSPRVAELAVEVSGPAGTVLGKVRAVERFLRANYRYTLDTGPEATARPLEDFLFVRKSGYCEHYATAMAMMLRSLGIPTRLVTGFLADEWNDFGRYYTVRQRDAHAWVEVYFPRSGWVVFDPTPSVGAEPAGLYTTVVGRLVDSLRLKWDRVVIQYSFRDQAAFARGLRERGGQAGGRLSAWVAEALRRAADDWREAVRWAGPGGWVSGGGLVVGLGAAGLWVLIVRRWKFPHGRRRAGAEVPGQAALVRLYAAMVRVLETRGLPKAPGATPLEFARQVARQWAEAAPFVGPLTDLYCRVRFGQAALSLGELKRAWTLLAGLRAARRPAWSRLRGNPLRRRMTRLAGLLVVTLALPGCTLWHYQLGSSAYKHGDYAGALDHFRQAAQAGDADSQHNLGYLYVQGQGTPSDPVQGRYWFGKAAAQGVAAAQYNYALMCAEGRGGPKDPTEAAGWYQKAAEQGDVRAQLNLGLLFDQGEGVPKSEEQAVRWYRKAAEQGLAQAQFNLGVMYDNGQGVPRDDAEAVMWYRKAAGQGLAQAQFNLALMYDEGEGVPKNDAEAVRWYRRAAEQGEPAAQHNLGLMYAKGEGIARDPVAAYLWFALAVEYGYRDSLHSKEVVARKMTPAEIAAGEKLIKEWKAGRR